MQGDCSSSDGEESECSIPRDEDDPEDDEWPGLIPLNEYMSTVIEMPNIMWHGYFNPPKSLTVTNNGKSISITGFWGEGRPYVSGGPLNGLYLFSEIHFHLPSDHVLNEKRYPLEMHVVHYKASYLTQERAMHENDGTVVFVYLFEADLDRTTSMSKITRILSCIKETGNRVEMKECHLEEFLKPFRTNYFLYRGSEKLGNATGFLQWIISCSQMSISNQELSELQAFFCSEGKSEKSNTTLMLKPRPQSGDLFLVGETINRAVSEVYREEAQFSNRDRVTEKSKSCCSLMDARSRWDKERTSGMEKIYTECKKSSVSSSQNQENSTGVSLDKNCQTADEPCNVDTQTVFMSSKSVEACCPPSTELACSSNTKQRIDAEPKGISTCGRRARCTSDGEECSIRREKRSTSDPCRRRKPHSCIYGDAIVCGDKSNPRTCPSEPRKSCQSESDRDNGDQKCRCKERVLKVCGCSVFTSDELDKDSFTDVREPEESRRYVICVKQSCDAEQQKEQNRRRSLRSVQLSNECRCPTSVSKVQPQSGRRESSMSDKSKTDSAKRKSSNDDKKPEESPSCVYTGRRLNESEKPKPKNKCCLKSLKRKSKEKENGERPSPSNKLSEHEGEPKGQSEESPESSPSAQKLTSSDQSQRGSKPAINSHENKALEKDESFPGENTKGKEHGSVGQHDPIIVAQATVGSNAYVLKSPEKLSASSNLRLGRIRQTRAITSRTMDRTKRQNTSTRKDSAIVKSEDLGAKTGGTVPTPLADDSKRTETNELEGCHVNLEGESIAVTTDPEKPEVDRLHPQEDLNESIKSRQLTDTPKHTGEEMSPEEGQKKDRLFEEYYIRVEDEDCVLQESRGKIDPSNLKAGNAVELQLLPKKSEPLDDFKVRMENCILRFDSKEKTDLLYFEAHFTVGAEDGKPVPNENRTSVHALKPASEKTSEQKSTTPMDEAREN